MTIKQLYEMAKEKGYENAIIGIDLEEFINQLPVAEED